MSKKQETKPIKLSLDGNYPGLNGLSYWIGYLEQFLAILSEPLLIACAALAVVDFMTGGRLLELPVLNYTWASSLAIAVTACFIVTWRRSIKAFTLNRYGVSISLAILGLLLGVVDFAAIAVQALQQTLNISFAQALSLLNLNVVMITYTRAGVTIAMAVVVALSNHTAVTTAQAPKRRLAFLDKALDKIAPVVTIEESNPLAIPEVAMSHEEANSMATESNQALDPIDVLRAKPESKYSLIKKAMSNAVANGEKINMKAISLETGAGYSTVKMYAPTIKQELGIKE